MAFAIPVLAIPCLAGALILPVAADLGKAALPDGRTLHLALGPLPTDVSYSTRRHLD